MKKLIRLLNAILSWIKRLFTSKKETRQPDIIEKRVEVKHQRIINRRHIPSHNNRKNTRGRRTQHVHYDRTSRPIYHSVVRSNG